MKVAILTYHFVYNHGANLQALATTLAFRDRGCDVEVIDWRPQDLEDDFRRKVPEEQSALHAEFISRHLPLSPVFRRADEIRDYYAQPANRPDLIVVGSDTVLSVFSPRRARLSNYRYGNPFWLNWVDDTPELRDIPTAYMSVSNTGSWYFLLDRSTRRDMLTSLRRRRIITVRDCWTRWMIRSMNPLTADMPIYDNYDPVLSLNRYFNFASVDVDRLNLPRRYVLFNVPHQRCTERWIRNFLACAAADGCDVLAFPNPQNNLLGGGMRRLFPLSPLAWYKVIQGAAGYVGSRFHPVVVALANQVPFVSVDTYGLSPLCFLGGNYPSKTYDLCRKAGRGDLVIKSRFLPVHSAEGVYSKLRTQNPDSTLFVEEAQRVFAGFLDRMCVLSSPGEGTKSS